MKKNSKSIILGALVALIVGFAAGFFGVKAFTKTSNSNGAPESKQAEVVSVSLGESIALKGYVPTTEDIEATTFENGLFEIDEEYNIKANTPGLDMLTVSYEDGSSAVVVLNAVELKVELAVGDVYEMNLENVKSATFENGGVFSIDGNNITALKSGKDTLVVTYPKTNDSEEKIVKYVFECTSKQITLGVGVNASLADNEIDVENIKEATVNDSAVFNYNNGNISALQEGTGILTITYNDGTTEKVSLVCSVETSNAATSKSFTWTLNKSNGSGGTSTVYGSQLSTGKIYFYSDAKHNRQITYLPSNPTRSGYTFGGYYTSPSCSGSRLINNNGYIDMFQVITSNRTLYACWRSSRKTVTLDKANGTQGTSYIYFTPGGSKFTDANGNAITKISIPARGGYKFLGYFAKGSDGKEYTRITAQGVINSSPQYWSNTYKYYAKWESISKTNNNSGSTSSATGYVSVALDQQGGSGGTTYIYRKSSDTYNYYMSGQRGMVVAGYITVPKKSGKKFNGYYQYSNCGGYRVIKENGYVAAAPSYYQNTTKFYACWK